MESPIGNETCEERGYQGGDGDDVWFYYHPICYGAFIESLPSWPVELIRPISREADEEYVCDLCGALLSEHPAPERKHAWNT